jgi:hypothetical protein
MSLYTGGGLAEDLGLASGSVVYQRGGGRSSSRSRKSPSHGDGDEFSFSSLAGEKGNRHRYVVPGSGGAPMAGGVVKAVNPTLGGSQVALQAQALLEGGANIDVAEFLDSSVRPTGMSHAERQAARQRLLSPANAASERRKLERTLLLEEERRAKEEEEERECTHRPALNAKSLRLAEKRLARMKEADEVESEKMGRSARSASPQVTSPARSSAQRLRSTTPTHQFLKAGQGRGGGARSSRSVTPEKPTFVAAAASSPTRSSPLAGSPRPVRPSTPQQQPQRRGASPLPEGRKASPKHHERDKAMNVLAGTSTKLSPKPAALRPGLGPDARPGERLVSKSYASSPQARGRRSSHSPQPQPPLGSPPPDQPRVKQEEPVHDDELEDETISSPLAVNPPPPPQMPPPPGTARVEPPEGKVGEEDEEPGDADASSLEGEGRVLALKMVDAGLKMLLEDAEGKQSRYKSSIQKAWQEAREEAAAIRSRLKTKVKGGRMSDASAAAEFERREVALRRKVASKEKRANALVAQAICSAYMTMNRARKALRESPRSIPSDVVKTVGQQWLEQAGKTYSQAIPLTLHQAILRAVQDARTGGGAASTIMMGASVIVAASAPRGVVTPSPIPDSPSLFSPSPQAKASPSHATPSRLTVPSYTAHHQEQVASSARGPEMFDREDQGALDEAITTEADLRVRTLKAELQHAESQATLVREHAEGAVRRAATPDRSLPGTPKGDSAAAAAAGERAAEIIRDAEERAVAMVQSSQRQVEALRSELENAEKERRAIQRRGRVSALFQQGIAAAAKRRLTLALEQKNLEISQNEEQMRLEIKAERETLQAEVDAGRMRATEAEKRLSDAHSRWMRRIDEERKARDVEVSRLREEADQERRAAETRLAAERAEASRRLKSVEEQAEREATQRIREMEQEAERREKALEGAVDDARSKERASLVVGMWRRAADSTKVDQWHHRAEVAEEELRRLHQELAKARAELESEKQQRREDADVARGMIEEQEQRTQEEVVQTRLKHKQELARELARHQRELAQVSERAAERQLTEYRTLMERYLQLQSEKGDAVAAEALAKRELKELRDAVRAERQAAAELGADKTLTGFQIASPLIATEDDEDAAEGGGAPSASSAVMSGSKYAQVLEGFSSEIAQLRKALGNTVREKNEQSAKLVETRAALTTAIAQRDMLRSERSSWKTRLDEQNTELRNLLEEVKKNKLRLVDSLNGLAGERQTIEEDRGVLQQRETLVLSYYSHLGLPLPAALFPATSLPAVSTPPPGFYPSQPTQASPSRATPAPPSSMA